MNDNKKKLIFAIVGIVLAVVVLAYAMRSVSKAEEYTPSPGRQSPPHGATSGAPASGAQS